MARLDAENVQRAAEIIGALPEPRSALIPLLHLAQEQDGYVTEDAMGHIAELLGHHAGGGPGHRELLRDVQAGAGRHAISCPSARTSPASSTAALRAARTRRAGARCPAPAAPSADGMFTLEEVECIARVRRGTLPPGQLPLLRHRDARRRSSGSVDDLLAGRLERDVPRHGMLNRVHVAPTR